MKAQRRHELKTNTLAHSLENLPALWRQHGGRILLGVVAALAVALAIRFSVSNARERQRQASEAYASALDGINNVQNLSAIRDPRAAVEQRRLIQEQANSALDQVLADTSDDALKAEALVARGDLNWYLATGPDFAAATSQPATPGEESDAELLDKARRAYESAVGANGARPLTVVIARLGLAAIAEQRGQWDTASAEYKKIIDAPATPAPFKTEAETRLADLTKIRQPVLLGQPATAPAPLPEGPLAPTPTTTPTTTPTSTPSPATQTQPVTQDAEAPVGQ